MEVESDKKYMRLALKEAAKGLGRTSPNPCVGAVIVKDGRILATGYHKKAGTPHAERNAINSVGTTDAAKESLAGATIYVTLEPCSHTGRTPPCCDAIIEQKFSRVVIGMEDPNPLVNGGGIARLKQAGIEVECGILAEECRQLNRPFLKHIATGFPWTIMKAGVSLDGRLNYQLGESGWITGKESLRRVHQLRNEVDAIMVGCGTVLVDNPSLTTRLEQGGGRDAIRVVLDSFFRIPLDAKLYTQPSDAGTLVFCGEKADAEYRKKLEALGVIVQPLPLQQGVLPLREVLGELGKREICSVLVEGGGTLHGAMIREKLYDEAALFYAPLFAGSAGISLVEQLSIAGRENAPSLEKSAVEQLGDNWMVRSLFKKA